MVIIRRVLIRRVIIRRVLIRRVLIRRAIIRWMSREDPGEGTGAGGVVGIGLLA